jgi:hypothetical protein
MAPRIQHDRGFNDTDPAMPPPGGFREPQKESSRDSDAEISPQVIEAGGEGNHEADRVYRDGVANTLATKDVDALADEAKEALAGPEGDSLRAAEKKGKSRGVPASKPSPVFPKKQRH